ncbi:MAG TPA: hypothetical protein VLT32_02790 [Candidatus Sulfomarinibacteraceae bacterium]|nr:hypothetical protein [Candidatus Sulfomarinibacteraceae bacterium]
MSSKITFAVTLIVLAGGVAQAQTQPAAPAGEKSIAATLNVYVFPTEGQTAAQQSTDEAACYDWAVQNAGVDPFALQKQAQQAQQQAQQAQQQAAQAQGEIAAAGKGAGVKGAVGGAAAGALIGEIASDDAGEGAAYGAAAGAVIARRRAKHAQAEASQAVGQQTQQAQQQAQQTQQATAEQTTNFKKAFSVCLEAKKYMVKY